MYLPRIAIIAIMSVAPAALGCRCPSGCCIPATPHAPCDLTVSSVEPTPPNLVLLTPECQSEGCGLQPLPSPSETYHLLTPADCQCRAATNANIANMHISTASTRTLAIICHVRIIGKPDHVPTKAYSPQAMINEGTYPTKASSTDCCSTTDAK